MRSKVISVLLFIFLFLAVPVLAETGEEEFNISRTADFDSGFKSNSSNIFEVETFTDNPSIAKNQLQLAGRMGSSFTFKTDNMSTWKLNDGGEERFSETRIENNLLILNTTRNRKTVSVELKSKFSGNFSIQTEIPEWTFYNPYGEENESHENESNCIDPPKKISPVLECVEHNENGTYTAHFGYYNRNDNCTAYIPIGIDNRFAGQTNGQNAGQPEYFAPGRVRGNFSVYFERGAVVWILKSPNGKTSTATASSSPAQMCTGNEPFAESNISRASSILKGVFSAPNNLLSMAKISGFISLAPVPIFPPPDPNELSDYQAGLIFTEGRMSFSAVSYNRTHVQMTVRDGFNTEKKSKLIYPNKIFNGDKLFLKIERKEDDFFGYYKINNNSWKIIGNISDTGSNGEGKIEFSYRSPKRADGPGARFSNYLIKNAQISDPPLIYMESGEWTSSELNVPDEMKLLESTFKYSGDYENFISSVKFVNSTSEELLAEYSYDLVNGNNLSIKNPDLTSGSFDNVTGPFKIKINFKGNGNSTPILYEISGKYRLINTAPEIEILEENETKTHSKENSFDFKVVDLEQNITDAVLFIDGKEKGSRASIKNNTEANISASASLGKHFYWIEADDSDLTGVSERYSFEVINDPPEIQIETENNTITSNSTPEIFFKLSDIENETLSAELLFNNSSVDSDETIPNNTSVSLIPREGLEPGRYSFWIKAGDRINNSVSPIRLITICSVPELNISMVNNSTITYENITLGFKITDKDDGEFNVTLFLDGENSSLNLTAENGTPAEFNLINLSAGNHSYWFEIDDGKMVHTYPRHLFRVKNNPPVIEMNTTNITTNKTSAEIKFKLIDEEQGTLSAVLFLNGTNVSLNNSIKNSTLSKLIIPESLNLTDGIYSYWIEAVDGKNFVKSSNYSLLINTSEEENNAEDGDSSNNGGSSGSGSSGGGGGGGYSGSFSEEEPVEEEETNSTQSAGTEPEEPSSEESETTPAEEENQGENQTEEGPTGFLTAFGAGKIYGYLVAILGFISLIGGWYVVRVRNR